MIYIVLMEEHFVKDNTGATSRFLRDNSGVTAIEYGLLAAGIAIAIIAAVNATRTPV
jgi:pilus assembly protein Flp/PilA